MNSTFCARWLATLEVISQVVFTSKQPKKNKIAFVGVFSQIKLPFGPLLTQLAQLAQGCPNSARKQHVGANTKSFLARFCDSNWEKGEDFVKICHLKKASTVKESGSYTIPSICLLNLQNEITKVVYSILLEKCRLRLSPKRCGSWMNFTNLLTSELVFFTLLFFAL